jgi:hypothetical protein
LAARFALRFLKRADLVWWVRAAHEPKNGGDDPKHLFSFEPQFNQREYGLSHGLNTTGEPISNRRAAQGVVACPIAQAQTFRVVLGRERYRVGPKFGIVPRDGGKLPKIGAHSNLFSVGNTCFRVYPYPACGI